MPLIRRLLAADVLRIATAAFLMGAILHLCTTFVLARIGATQPFSKVVKALPINEVRLLPPVTPKTQVLPFEAADVITTACAFDASQGPVLVRAVLAGAGWTLALYSPTGTNFYSIAGQDGRRTEIALMLVPAGDEFVPMPRDPTGQQQRIEQVTLPAKAGLMLLRAPLPGQAWRREIETDLKLASCQLRKK